ncbi:transcriptional regulator, LysR family [Roseovarius marisflavi]|uniref:Transcriptional regulator, LysR family n=2 Tax=Roseovarius marisflavi TaxID=1054996 RepID=A0A1M7BDN2_9RHOB|nr:transcriptional regulator, LysR family [Roseovarius marisflavi]
MPSLNSLRALEAVARHLSYPAAAEELGVTPAAVKQLIVKLEDALDKKLVERRGRGLALSETAMTATNDLSLAMRHLTDAVRGMRESRDTKRLIVSVESSLATTWLVPRLHDFCFRHPNIDVLIDSSQRIVDLKRSDVDVAIRYGVGTDPDLITHQLFEDCVAPACSPTLAEGPLSSASLDQLPGVPLIHWDIAKLPWATQARRWFDWSEWARREGISNIEAGSGLHFSDYGMAVQAAISGQGIILASKPILHDQFDAGLLVLPFANSSTKTGIGYDLVMTKQADDRPEVMAFTDWLRSVSH